MALRVNASNPFSFPARRANVATAVSVAVAALAVAALVGPATVPATAATFGTQGIPSRPGAPQAEIERSAALAARAGAKLMRVEADWAALEPRASGERSAAAVDALDRVLAALARRKIRPILVLVRTPCWASAAPAAERRGCDGIDINREAVWRYRPAAADSAVPIATFLAARYASRLAAFQIWNEPDQSNEKYWAGSDKAETYTAFVRALYRPLKQAAPRVPVLAGSFVGTNGRWLQAMYDNGVRGFYDGLAVQFYSRTLYGLRNTRAVQRRNGDTKPMWLTEFGFTACYRRGGPRLQFDQPCVSRAGAARGLSDVLTAIRGRSWIKAAIQYALYDDPPGGYTFGLAESRGRLKETYRAVRRVLTGRVTRPVRPTLSLRPVRGRVVVSGTASLAEMLTLRVSVGGQLRLRGTLVTDRLNRFRIVLPAILGTRGISVRVSAGWTGSVSARR